MTIQNKQLTEQEILMFETVLKIAALEKLLTKKNIITTTELTDEMKVISEEVVALTQKMMTETKESK